MKSTQKRRGTVSGILMLFAGILMIAAALVLLLPTLFDYKKSNDLYDRLDDTYVIVPEDIAEEESNDTWWYQEIDVKLEELKKENEDIIGWIRFDKIDSLSYPILYSGDNDTYLRTDIYGNNTIAGCIFMEGKNHPDFKDCHTILYGHNMKNESMFGSLKNYKTEGFYKEHQYFTIYTGEAAYRYRIFAYRDVPEEDAVYTVGFVKDDTFGEFADQMKRGSYIETRIEVSKEDQVITLSTCSTKDNRFVVHAVRIGEHTYPVIKDENKD